MAKNVIYADNAQKKLFDGIEKVAKAVSSTLGPRGKLVVMESQNGMGTPIISKDGVTVAKAFSLKDKYENLGVNLIKEVAGKSGKVGDGTTTATILAYALAKEGLKVMSAGASPTDLKKGIDVATKQVVDLIEKKSKPIEKAEDIYNVAKISANNDELIGKLVSEAFEKIGNDGTISVDESSTSETYISFKEGMCFDKGWISPYFVNNEKFQCELKDCFVLVTDETISSAKQIINILNKVAQTGKPLVIIADDVTGEVLPILIMNNAKGSIRCNVVKAPSYGENRKAILEDIAVLTGGCFVSETVGLKLSDIDIHHLGNADKIVSSKEETIIVGGNGSSSAIEERVKKLKAQMETETSDVNIDKLKERIAKLSGGVCVLNVSAETEVQMKELKDRIEDTLCSVKASLKEGIVCGGGVTLAMISKELVAPKELNSDELVGFNIVKNALVYPLKTLAENADMSADVVISETLKNTDGKCGYNMLTREWDKDLSTKVVDPTLVETSAIKNASSVVGLILTTNVAIVEEDEKEAN